MNSLSRVSRAWILISLCMIVLSGFLAAGYTRCPNYGRALLRKLTGSSRVDSTTKFRWMMSASGSRPTGAQYDSESYVSSDCVEIALDRYRFTSRAEAEADFRKRIEGSASVLDRSERPGSERLVIQKKPGGDYLILILQVDHLEVITSPSLAHALEFERRLSSGTL
jgi:hypothetical protein